MTYVDGFLIPVPKKNLKAYTALAKKAGEVWNDHGSVSYFETVLHDAAVPKGCLSFPKGVKVKPGEAVVFSWITYKSKAHRDAVNKKVMKDPRMLAMMKDQKMPFDPSKMMHGGFKVLVEL